MGSEDSSEGSRSLIRVHRTQSAAWQARNCLPRLGSSPSCPEISHPETRPSLAWTLRCLPTPPALPRLIWGHIDRSPAEGHGTQKPAHRGQFAAFRGLPPGFRTLGGAFRGLANGYRRLERAFRTLELRVRRQFLGVGRQFRRVGRQFRRVGRQFRRVGRQFRRVGRQFRRVGRQFLRVRSQFLRVGTLRRACAAHRHGHPTASRARHPLPPACWRTLPRRTKSPTGG
jgi:hypothetical protein